jgi:prolyl-tRNA synthetase
VKGINEMSNNEAIKMTEKKVRTAITPTRDENFPEWYQSVIKAADMAETSASRGCMVIKPTGYAIWEKIQRIMDDLIKAEDVQNAYFPLLIPLNFLSREAEHIEGFAKETAIVTHHRLIKGENGLIPDPESKLEEPFIIRPTSETIIGDSVSNWVQSYRDLPLKLNQWCNVFRWEMRTRLFLRTAEFLWQEGHNAFATPKEAHEDALLMLDVYNNFFENYMAVPGFKGEKTADERFPGALNTYTIEAMMQDGKAVQMCTSHDLGTNFAKSFDIKYQGVDGNMTLAHTTSWGLSTRVIGGLIMIHADDDGLILPPRLAPTQVMIIPVVREEGADEVLAACDSLVKELKARGVSAKVDKSDRRTPDKMWDAIKKGIPLRVEIGLREMQEGKLTHVRRDIGKDSKETVATEEFLGMVQGILDQMHNDIFSRAKALRDANVKDVSSMADIKALFANGHTGFVRADVALLEDAARDEVFKEFSLTPRCVPFEDNGKKILIGKSY